MIDILKEIKAEIEGTDVPGKNLYMSGYQDGLKRVREILETTSKEFFVVTRISRDDIKGTIQEDLSLTDEQINSISDEDMQDFATKMGEAYVEGGQYWDSLEELVQHHFRNKIQ